MLSTFFENRPAFIHCLQGTSRRAFLSYDCSIAASAWHGSVWKGWFSLNLYSIWTINGLRMWAMRRPRTRWHYSHLWLCLVGPWCGACTLHNYQKLPKTWCLACWALYILKCFETSWGCCSPALTESNVGLKINVWVKKCELKMDWGTFAKKCKCLRKSWQLSFIAL